MGDDDVFVEEKVKDIYAGLPNTTFNLGTFKNYFFDYRDLDKNYFESEQFHESFDSEGFNFYIGEYLDNEGFGTLPFIQRNRIAGIMIQMDSPLAHKYLFGSFKLFTSEKPFLKCIFLTRGKLRKEVFGDQFDLFSWKELNYPADKKLIVEEFDFHEKPNIFQRYWV